VWYLLHLTAVKIERGSMAHVRPACVVEGDQRTLSNLNYIFMERNPYPVNIYATGYTLILHLFSNSVKVEPSVKSP
jgi:hypothetical protein